MGIKTYSEMILLPTFEERFEYLKIGGIIGVNTFGSHRYLNQVLYQSQEWKNFRREIIIRDKGRDLAVDGYEIEDNSFLHVHHIEPLTPEDVIQRSYKIFDLDNVICVSEKTHKAIHYSGINATVTIPITRKPYDTCPWRH